MDELNIPIDIHTNKLLDWLVSRRHVNKEWQNNIIVVREKINNAIQDMPAHEGIIKLLSGQHINYFHCKKIIEILKETEADSKNLFGRYGSQRMKDWQDIMYYYEKDNVYLAEAAQILIRNVCYEIPSLRKQIAKLDQNRIDAEKKIKDYTKTKGLALKEFHQLCEQLGIKGKNIKTELLDLLRDLPTIYEGIAKRINLLKPVVELYVEFVKFSSLNKANVQVLEPLKYLMEFGNTTVYEYKYGKKPLKTEDTHIKIDDVEKAIDEINFDVGEIDFGDSGETVSSEEIDFSILTSGNSAETESGSTEEGFEIVDMQLEESGIVVEKSDSDEDIARGTEALTILDCPDSRNKIIDCLIELDSFLKLRLYEMSCDSDLLSMSQMQDASNIMQIQTIESITQLHQYVNISLNDLLNKRISHLHNIKHSSKYVDILTENLNQKLNIVEKMKTNTILLENKIILLKDETVNIEKSLKLMIISTKQLQKEVEEDVSSKYKGRSVNIVGSINML